MGVLFDYFTADSDAEAAATIDRLGGPGQPATGSAANARRGRFLRRSKAADDAPGGEAYPTVADTGIDPVVQGGTLEEHLTGRPYADVERDPRWGRILAARDEGERLVLTLTDGLVDALAQADDQRLAAAAVPWSKTEEFRGTGDPDQLVNLLHDLSALARDARSRGKTLYCWVCV